MTLDEIRIVVRDALEACREAAQDHDNQLGAEQSRGLDCGFAWVVCKPGNGTLARVLKEFGADKHHAGGVSLWNPAKLSTQSIGPKETGARVFVNYVKDALRQNGYTDLFYASRLD